MIPDALFGSIAQTGSNSNTRDSGVDSFLSIRPVRHWVCVCVCVAVEVLMNLVVAHV